MAMAPATSAPGPPNAISAAMLRFERDQLSLQIENVWPISKYPLRPEKIQNSAKRRGKTSDDVMDPVWD